MNIALRILLGFVLLFVALFCAFGFLATFEPIPTWQRILFQILYGCGGGACMLGILRLFMPRPK